GAESFTAAWDAALGQPVRRVTIDDLEFLAYHGLVRPRFRGGRYLGSRQKPDNSALLRLVSLYDRAVARADRLGDTYCSEIRDMRVTKGYTGDFRVTR